MASIRRVAYQRARHHWSDRVGFLSFLALAATVLRRTPILGVMLLPVFVSDVVVSVAFLVRRPAKARLEGWGPRIAAYGGTLLIPAFFALGGSRYPSWVTLTHTGWAVKTGCCLWLVGLVLNIWTVWQLRHSFSLAPQARELVRTGPYRLARHPIYATHLLMALGICLWHFTLPVAIALLAWVGLIAARIHYEEMVLEATFPEYAEYRREVGLFGPRLFPARTAREEPARLPPNTLRVSGASSPVDWRNR